MAKDDKKQLVAQGGDVDGEDAAPAGKKKLAGKQLILFIVLPAVVLLGGGGAAAYFLLIKKPPVAEGAEQAKAETKKKEKKPDKKGEKGGDKKEGEGAAKTSEGPDGEGFLTMPDMVVNISTGDGRPSYLKLRLTLQAKDMEIITAIEPSLPVLMDQCNGFLRDLRMEDVAGSAGYARIQLELLKRINLAIAPAEIEAVLIEEMLIN
jgi:flagellar FliL protein